MVDDAICACHSQDGRPSCRGETRRGGWLFGRVDGSDRLFSSTTLSTSRLENAIFQTSKRMLSL